MSNHIEIATLSQILCSTDPASGLTGSVHALLLMKGAVFSLYEDGSAEAVHALVDASQNSAIESIQTLAFSMVNRLADEHNQPAVDALFSLAVEFANLAAKNHIDENALKSSSPAQHSAYRMLYRPIEEFQTGDPGLQHITYYYFEVSGTAGREALLRAASRRGYRNWSLIVSSIDSLDDSEVFQQILKDYPQFKQEERLLALDLLEERAAGENPAARELLIQLFILHEDPHARAFTLETGMIPADAVQRALYYFLSEQWDLYDQQDFSRSLLVAGYESAGPVLRKRILAHSRYAGQTEWMQMVSGGGALRALEDMDDADWEAAIQRMFSPESFELLWRLSQSAPPIWSAEIIAKLQQRGWKPEPPDQENFFTQLVPLAEAALRHPLTLHQPIRLSMPEGNLLAHTASRDGSRLAAGGNGSQVYIWKLPEGTPLNTKIIGPAPIHRALTLSNQAEFLATANGDDQIRVFQLPDGRVIKTLSGHQNVIRSLCLHPDERTLFSAGFDGALRAWRHPFGPELMIIEKNRYELYAVITSSDGKTILSAGADQLIKTWRWPDGALLREIRAHTAPVTLLVGSGTGQIIASYGADRAIRIWNYTSGRLLTEIILDEDTPPVTALAVHPNEQVVISGDDRGLIQFWSVSTGKPIAPYALSEHQSRVIGLSFTAGGEFLVSASIDGRLRLWSLETFLLTRLGINLSRPESITKVQQLISKNSNRVEETHWLKLALELMRWRQRFDVEIGEIERIELGEFDIEL